MTREKAISLLEQIGRHECIWMVCRHKEVYEAIDMAIESLKHNHMICPHCLKDFYLSEVRFVVEEGDGNEID